MSVTNGLTYKEDTMAQSEREDRLRGEAVVLLRRLGYSENEAIDAGLLYEVHGALNSAENNGYRRGYSEGHDEGWEDHGRERGCNCS